MRHHETSTNSDRGAHLPELRLVLTNDIFGSFLAESTSWGRTSGGDALVQTVDRLRHDARSTAWIDGGDFSGGGPLSPATEGRLGWEAAAHLPIEAAVPGNHEFDYGDDAADDYASAMPFPLIATDLRNDLSWTRASRKAQLHPHWVLTEPQGHAVAVVGLALPERRGPAVYGTPPDLERAIETVRECSNNLKGDVDHIVAVIHDGVDDTPPAKAGHGFQLDRMTHLCAGVHGLVDAVVGGHTLNRHVGRLAGVPFIQPWALATEVGVLDFEHGEVHLRTASVHGDSGLPPEDLGWTGPGSTLASHLRATIVGETPIALSTLRSGAGNLGAVLAAGLRSLTRADVVIVTHEDTAAGQIGLDGVLNWIPAGAVSEEQIYRALPWAAGRHGDGAWAADLTREQVVAVARSLNTATGAAYVSTTRGTGQIDNSMDPTSLPGGVTIVNSNYLPTAQRAIGDGDKVEWQSLGWGLRDGLRHALSNHPTPSCR